MEGGGKRLEVVLPAGLGVSRGASRATGHEGAAGPGSRRHGAVGVGDAGAGPVRGRQDRRAGRGRSTSGSGTADGDSLVSPMQGTIVKIVAPDGQQVAAGETIVVLEAMKMEQPLTAHKDGTVSDLAVEVGQTVSAGQVICRLAG